jgi:hypothetical protein
VQALCLPGGAPRRRGLHVSRPGCEPGRDHDGTQGIQGTTRGASAPRQRPDSLPEWGPGTPHTEGGVGRPALCPGASRTELALARGTPRRWLEAGREACSPSAARRRGRRHPLSPGSCDRTWDAIGGNHGPDVSSIHVPLKEVFESMLDRPRSPRDRRLLGRRLIRAIAWTGNGDLFTDLIAFSPGFIPPAERRGRPAVYIATAYPIRPSPPHEPADRAVAAVRGLPRRLP